MERNDVFIYLMTLIMSFKLGLAQTSLGDSWDPDQLNTITTAVPFLMIAPDI